MSAVEAATEMLLSYMERSHKHDIRLVEMIAEAVKSGEPVLYGVWGPTGQRVFIVAEFKPSGAANAD